MFWLLSPKHSDADWPDFLSISPALLKRRPVFLREPVRFTFEVLTFEFLLRKPVFGRLGQAASGWVKPDLWSMFFVARPETHARFCNKGVPWTNSTNYPYWIILATIAQKGSLVRFDMPRANITISALWLTLIFDTVRELVKVMEIVILQRKEEY